MNTYLFLAANDTNNTWVGDRYRILYTGRFIQKPLYRILYRILYRTNFEKVYIIIERFLKSPVDHRIYIKPTSV